MTNTKDFDLPEYIDPFRMSDVGEQLKGKLPLALFSRLQEILYSSDGLMSFELRFGKDENGLRVIDGEIEADLSLICQRCNQPMTYSIKENIRLSPIINEKQATGLPSDREPLVTSGEPVLLRNVLEDEILLALPMFAKHMNSECR